MIGMYSVEFLACNLSWVELSFWVLFIIITTFVLEYILLFALFGVGNASIMSMFSSFNLTFLTHRSKPNLILNSGFHVKYRVGVIFQNEFKY